MRTIDPALQAHLDAGVTTLCRCWRLERSDGAVLGFSDHDRDVAFAGDAYEPATGFDASEETSALGFAIGGLEVSGALTSDRLDEADLASGLYDNAEVRLFLVNWQTPAERLLLRVGHLGEVSREDGAFRAEIRGLAALLDEPKGRAYRPSCDADLGDGRCTVDVGNAAYHANGTVAAPNGRRRFTASGLGSFDAGWFDRGKLTWTSGANAGRAIEVRAHRVGDDGVTIELWQPAPEDITAGDGFALTAGCDKLFTTCQAKFANSVNFRGFPHMPGDDFALSYARAGEQNDGGALVG
jgi:uncharacterized phage protein (TIGR02218 family)